MKEDRDRDKFGWIENKRSKFNQMIINSLTCYLQRVMLCTGKTSHSKNNRLNQQSLKTLFTGRERVKIIHYLGDLAWHRMTLRKVVSATAGSWWHFQRLLNTQKESKTSSIIQREANKVYMLWTFTLWVYLTQLTSMTICHIDMMGSLYLQTLDLMILCGGLFLRRQ